MYPSSLPNIDLEVLPTFPAHVGVTGVLTLVKSGLTYTFGVNFQNVSEETNVSDMSKREVLVQDTDTGAFWRVKLSNLPTGQTDWANIQNKPATFPPSPHTHPVAEISDATLIGSAVFTAPDEATAQAALDVPPNARTISAGTGLTGGGDLSADRTLALASVGSNQILANLTGSTAAPTGNSLSAILDTLTNVQGSIAYRGASGWTALAPGSVGQVLTSGGAGADPSWQNAAAVAVDPWECLPIGVPIPVFDHIPGVTPPPTDRSYRYIKLTAGESGVGGYNEGVLTGENVSGSAPLVDAGAFINLPSSPMHGQGVRLINTERRFIRAGSSGTLQDDAMQGHWHVAVNNSGRFSPTTAGSGGVVTSHQADGVNSDSSWVGVRTATSDGSNGTPRVANETRARNIGATYFMRIL